MNYEYSIRVEPKEKKENKKPKPYWQSVATKKFETKKTDKIIKKDFTHARKSAQEFSKPSSFSRYF